MRGLAPDRGLYFPEVVPKFPEEKWEDILQCSLPEMGAILMSPYIQDELNCQEALAIFDEVFNFDIPLVQVNRNIHSLELFHGPTAAFKDVGARFLSRVMSRFLDKKMTVLVATSGDTGSAVANGFLGVENIDVVLLYPSGRISEIQEKQLTTLGQNITALEVKGSFDQCQDMVKTLFLDEEAQSKRPLTSANSINLARWMPQGIYYAWALAQLEAEKPVIAVPSGNFGNLAAGMLMERMGMPVERFIAATNANDIVPKFLAGEPYTPKASLATISNAMDVGDPSNFVRMEHLLGGQEGLRKFMNGFSCNDLETREWLKRCFEEEGYLCDPHGAIGYGALKTQLQAHETGIFLETAHPAKFGDVVEPVIGQEVTIPERLAKCMREEKNSIVIEPTAEALKDFLL